MDLKNRATSSHEKLIAYYNKTKWDYRIFWFRSRINRAMHFGHFGDGIQKHSDALSNLNSVLSEKAGIRSGDLILDAGCGQGGSALWLAATFKEVSVEGITVVPHQIAIARREAIRQRLNDKVNFTLKDYCNTGFPDQHFSVVWACESLCHAEEKIRFYEEAYRILKPGGRLIIADGIRKKRPLISEDELLLQQWLQGWCCPDLDTWEEHQNNLNRTGFSRINMEDITPFVQPSLLKLAKLSRQALPLGKFLQAIRLRHKINYDNLLSAFKQYEAYQRDLWAYAIISAVKP